ncbi:hypothetical protein GLOTRDRAFT_63186 [Gloeophyllum trabeum ATCC 11539]|uniref:XPG-I domain-containing protein n=1 Tax=Gloeophyllum trabeum (strain ATCC 11539 / FP-39264 / Madison 617) TaxID=670483 RepID=S7RH68_GLOTA|nr:uncharacterized protein GLOTRDRAFT_63186 [Gloeophyllum trabeum ATCC 11539]EPQ53590.1 hypothetical protein GLOTRDRAFT_63186 [Gloeophyllum trabeum ATCC 11539]
MGVPGLWDILRPAGKVRSLTEISVVEGFEANVGGHRGFRIGIDASIWFFHAAYGREGENPELRTLFFRCCRLMNMPFLPLFVFDGPKRPSVKRGKRVSGNAHWLTTGMKNIIEAFGFEWRTAPGEAEAELAYLNRIGVIDAILSDDVDNFLFGATMVIRNPSNTLSGNKAHPVKNSAGRDDGNHSVVYKSEDFLDHPDIGLTQGGLILIGLLSGGDYHQAGLARCGPGTARGLAKCGFGDSLLEALDRLPREKLPDFLKVWRQQIRDELKTNSQGHLGRKNPSLAKSVPEDFPDIEILLSYARPITSESEGKSVKVRWTREPDLSKIAGLCELYFEWGVKDIIIKRFRTVLWPSAVLRILRRAALDADERAVLPSTPRKKSGHRPPIGTPSSMIAKHFSSMQLNSPSRGESDDEDGDEDEDEDEERLIVKIHSTRAHASTDGILEYRLEIAPAQLVRLSAAGVKGIRPVEAVTCQSDEDDDEGDEDDAPKGKGGKKAPPDPESHLRVWMPASMVKLAEPHIVEEYEAVQQKKADKKSKGRNASSSAGIKSKAAPKAPARREGHESPSTPSKARPKASTSRKVLSSKDRHVFDISDSSGDHLSARVEATESPVGSKSGSGSRRRLAKPRVDIVEEDESSGSEDIIVGRAAASATTSKKSGVSSKQKTLVDLHPVTQGSRHRTASASASASKGGESRRTASRQVPLLQEEECGSETYDLAPVIKPRGLGFQPRPPPSLPRTEEDQSDSEAHTLASLRSPRKTGRSRVSTTDSDTDRKSPRSSTSHSSPHSRQTKNRHEERRPVSPSPRGKSGTRSLKPKQPPAAASEVIDVSSDSDIPEPRMLLAPLLMAKARQRPAASKPSAVQSKPKMHIRSDIIIDLT